MLAVKRLNFSGSKSLLNSERQRNPELNIHLKKVFILFFESNEGFLSREISIRQSTCHAFQFSGCSETDKAYQRIIS